MTFDEHTAAYPVPSGVLAPYEAPDAHLTDLLRRHDLLLKRQLARGQARKPADILGFAAIGEQEVHRLLGESATPDAPAPDVRLIDQALQRLELEIDERVEQSRVHGVLLPIVELAKRFALTPAEIDLLFACLAVELDHRYERVYGYLHNDMSRRLASPGLAIGLYRERFEDRLSARALLSADAPLRYYRLLEVSDDGAAMPWLSRAIRVDERIVSFVVGERTMDSRIARRVALSSAGSEPHHDEGAGHGKDESLARIVNAASASRERSRSLIYLHGERHAGADALVRAAARRLHMPVLTVDAELLADAATDFDRALFLLFREGLLRQAAIYLREIDRALEPPHGTVRCRALQRCLADMGSIVFASGEQRWSWPLPAEPVVLRVVEVQPDGVADQLRAWQAMSGGRFSEGDVHQLVSLHPLPAAAIRDVWRMAQALVETNDGGGGAMPTLEHVQQACRAFAGAPVTTLARRIEPRHRLADLVLPTAQHEQLSAICSQAKHSSIVYGTWQFDRKLALGRGLNAMFTGQPGTGKTMAAEVIAAELGVDILKIDLSRIVSKYIGETEKNLGQMFDQAARANAILFFDEADALLGKRSDVKDAHDRYANTETAYLLQKMEEYPGITILSTNLRQNMDAAFTRRMRFIVDFPFPEDEDRLRIWTSVWPSEVPLGADVDFAHLARQFRLSGGSIRNVALAAAFLAAEQGQPVSMRHVMLATKREFQKMGRLVNEEEYRRYA
jgi:Winged helix domain, variant/ATPase family associated with various cellular activities (AAA)